MKYLLIFLLSFNLYAAKKVHCGTKTIAQVNACKDKSAKWKAKKIAKIKKKKRIKSVKHFRLAMMKCNVNRPNAALLKKEIEGDKDETLLKCLEDAEKVVELDVEVEKQEEAKRKSAKDYLKKYNCKKLKSSYTKNLCIYMKRRL